MLAPIYNAVNTLLARLTSARATKLDNLDAAITTRPAASDYTSSRASKLDNLDAAITSRSSHSATDVWAAGTRTLTSAPSPIKSLQSGLVDTSTTSAGTLPQGRYVDVTITSVDTAKAILLHSVLGGYSDTAANALTLARGGAANSSGYYAIEAKAYLASATTIRFYFGSSNANTAFSGRWQVIEFN